MNRINGIAYYKWNHPRNWIENIKIFWKNIKARWQRAWYGVSAMDCWDFDHYMLAMMENGLTTFKEDTNGYPHTLTYEEWMAIIDRMIELVQILQIDWFEYEGIKTYEEFEVDYEQNKQELFGLLITWSDHLWW